MLPPFSIRDLGEIAIRVVDMDAMFAFYRDVIGLEVLSPPNTNGIAFFRICEGHAGHTRVLALFERGAGRPEIRPSGQAAPETSARSTLHHIAFNVDYEAQEAARDWLIARGLTPVEQIFDWIGWRGIFVEDPDGNTVELVAYHPSLKKP